MPSFDKLIKDKKVANHPLLKGYKEIGQVRKNLTKHSQDLSREFEDPFTSGSPYSMENLNDLNEMIREAAIVIQDVFSQFEIPVNPKFFYEGSRDIKHARNDEDRVVEGSIVYGIEFRSTLGVLKRASVAIPIVAGEVMLPSVMEVDGSIYTISQSSLDDILQRNSSYYLPEIREGYQQPPMTRYEREIAVGIRNESGYQPIKNPGSNYMNQKVIEASRKSAAGSTPRMWEQVTEAMNKAEEDGLDTFPRPWIHVLRNYILDFVSTASKDAWEPHLINAGYCLNPYGGNMNRGRRRAQDLTADFEKDIDLEVEEPGVEMLLDEIDELEDKSEGKGPRFYPETKTPIESGDGVKFKHGPKGDPSKGTIVEIDEDRDLLIIKSKGMEFRVKVEDIEPMPSTFKKMYM